MVPHTNVTEPPNLDERIDVSPELAVSPDPVPKDVVFDVTDLSVYYGEFQAVRDVNVQINRPEITAFIGPSGCGKTTVLRSEEHTSELQSLMRTSYAVFC